MDNWTGILIGKMHNSKITLEDLAKHLGVTKAYVSMILNCKRKPLNAEQKFNKALDELIEIKTK